MLNIITFKTGTKYAAFYVNRMYAMCKRSIDIPFTFYCYTDNSSGIHPAVKTVSLIHELPNWWVKMLAFSEFMPEGDLLILDLDQIITGNLTDIINNAKGPISVSEDPYKWHGVTFGSAFMLIRNNAYKPLYKAFLEMHPPTEWDKLNDIYQGGDQMFMEKHISEWHSLDEQFPDEFLSYKKHTTRGTDPPVTSKVINFHGEPKQHQAPDVWIDQFWY